MPFVKSRPPAYKPDKDASVEWEDFGGGWNDIFKPTELDNDELTQADNLMLVGKGTPTGRWGSKLFNQAGENGRVRLIDSFVVGGNAASLASTNELLSITDDGYLVKKSGASYTIITGASFASGYNYQSVQLGNEVFIGAASLPYVKYDGANLVPYTNVGEPSITGATMLSYASGLNTYSWVVTAITQAGETGYNNTIGETMNRSLASLPLDLTDTLVQVNWVKPSAASGIIKGFNIYRGFPGDETFIAAVDTDTTQYFDKGGTQSFLTYPPDSNLTGGIKAKYILKFDDRIVLAGIVNDPSRIYISGRYPDQDRFDALGGGASIPISPDDGDEIVGLGIAGNQGMSSGGSAPPSSSILVFKRNSVHRVVVGLTTIGNYQITELSAQMLTSSNGCSAGDTVVPVENDTFYFGRKGLYTVGQEPNFLNQIRTNEISARIRTYIQSLSETDFEEACAGYMDNKYLLSFPTKKETIIYDRERAAFMGPWKTPWGITKWFKYYDTDGDEKWIAGTTETKNQEFSASYSSDSGTAISKILRTKKEDMGQWSMMKVLKLFYVLFRNVRGSVKINLRIETKDGNTVTTKSFSITSQLGDGGWGADQWGSVRWGDSDATVTLTGDELVRWAQIYKNIRVLQVEVVSNDANSNWEFLGTRFTARPLGDASLPADTRV